MGSVKECKHINPKHLEVRDILYNVYGYDALSFEFYYCKKCNTVIASNFLTSSTMTLKDYLIKKGINTNDT